MQEFHQPSGARAAARVSGSHFPRIYFLHGLAAGPLDRWERWLDEAASLGFDHVLISPPFRPGGTGDIYRTASHDALDDRLGSSGGADEALARLARACGGRRLVLLLDLVCDVLAPDADLVAAFPDSFEERGPAAQVIDPRRDPRDWDVRRARFSGASDDPLLRWWQDRVARWVDAGVGGFRALGLDRLPPASLTALIGDGATRRARWLAWTQGLPRDALPRLAACGFDATFSSSCWWDGRRDWLVEEHDALAAIAPAIALPEAPFARRLAAGGDGDPEAAARRALAIAAASGCGLMMPMGFERGARRALDPARVTTDAFEGDLASAGCDLRGLVAETNRLVATHPVLASDGAQRALTGADAAASAILRGDAPDLRTSRRALLLLVNSDPHRGVPSPIGAHVEGFGPFAPTGHGNGDGLLQPGEARLLAAPRARAIQPVGRAPDLRTAAASSRIAIEAISPCVDGGRFAAKRVVGEQVTVEADIFADGHDKLAAMLLSRSADERRWRSVPMAPLANDRWSASFPLERVGRYAFTVEAWRDAYATWRDDVEKKLAAGRDVALEIEEGRALLDASARRLADGADAGLAGTLTALARRLADGDPDARLAALLAPETAASLRRADERRFLIRLQPALAIDADRPEARFASWYELFPRSQSGDAARHGDFDDVVRQLPRIRAMGFDVLYLPPIHPIGRTNRKGRNNTVPARDGDPGSPYAIGAAAGGHDAIHPELGTLEDFHRLRDAAARHGMEIALDFAIQCSPDHPWLRQHPEWFAWRSDGSLRYAENPPKKYEDIVNVDFHAEGAIPALWQALRDVVEFWIAQGVRLFRVDNPHTKPLPFWEWLIADIRHRHPDAIFLAEAFTRPKMMNRLAKLGFTQSYTYFTWRNSKTELRAYLEELADGPARDFFRPHFFVNTPDINPVFLQRSGRAGFIIRATLAATLSGLWGMYSGFELCEGTPIPGREEYLDSEKYELRPRDWDRPGNIVAEIARLNRIRRANPALHTHLGVTFLEADNDSILWFEKATPSRDNVVLIAINLDPHAAHEAAIELPLWRWGVGDDAALELDDLLGGGRFVWRGKRQRIRLDPSDSPAAIWRARPAGALS